MAELTRILNRVNIENLVSYFLHGVDSSQQVFEDYEECLRDSFDDLFDKLESMYEKADRNDNRLFDAIVEFTTLHEVAYFEAGVLVGAELIKMFGQGSNNHEKENSKSAVIQLISDRMDTVMEKNRN